MDYVLRDHNYVRNHQSLAQAGDGLHIFMTYRIETSLSREVSFYRNILINILWQVVGSLGMGSGHPSEYSDRCWSKGFA